MQPVIRFPWDALEYADAFTTLLRCTEGRVHMHRFLRGRAGARLARRAEETEAVRVII